MPEPLFYDLTCVNTRDDTKSYDSSRAIGKRSWRTQIKRAAMAICFMTILATMSVVAKLAVEMRQLDTGLGPAANPYVNQASDTHHPAADETISTTPAEKTRVIGDNTVRRQRKASRHKENASGILLGDNPVGDSRTDLPSEIL